MRRQVKHIAVFGLGQPVQRLVDDWRNKHPRVHPEVWCISDPPPLWTIDFIDDELAEHDLARQRGGAA